MLGGYVRCSVSVIFFFLMIRRPPRSTLDRSSAASDVYKRQPVGTDVGTARDGMDAVDANAIVDAETGRTALMHLSLIHISEPTRPY